MPKAAIILSLLLLSVISKAQIVFKTEVPPLPVIAGESFRVQYILSGIETNSDVTAPPFTGFRMIGRPEVYHIDGSTHVKNIVYTLVAVKPGKFIIRGATVMVNGLFFKSDDAVIEVISKEEAIARAQKNENASEYFLRPGEDPYEKIRQNLFMKVWVNKKNCYVGEPVTATFKLYSRLQSKSDIVKNPGFYGFSVQDIVNLDDHLSNTETINGKTFDVHIVRAVQLYPLQAGLFVIDPMEVMNKVEFSKSIVNKKTEQEIREGSVEEKEQSGNDNAFTYESSSSTEKIAIHVKPHPERNKPREFSGATGNFSINAALERNELGKNEEGTLIITIRGKGNFTQLPAPVIQWPAGIEGFDAVIKDSLDKTQTPLKGTRIFHFPFIAGKPGAYTVPGISLAFFDPDSNNYKTVFASTVQVKITDVESGPAAVIQEIKNKAKNNSYALWWAGGSAIVLLLVAAWRFGKKRKQGIPETVTAEKKIYPGIEEFLQPAYQSLEKGDNQFYTILQKSIWDYLGLTLDLSGSKINKHDLQKAMQAKQLTEDQAQNILTILKECETAAYTQAEFIHDRHELLLRANTALEQIKC
jgi:hypothetical protein